jgi:hypothetical protein
VQRDPSDQSEMPEPTPLFAPEDPLEFDTDSKKKKGVDGEDEEEDEWMNDDN